MTKADLKKYIQLTKEAEELKKRAEYLEDEAKSLKAVVIDGMPKVTTINDSIGNIVAKIEKLRTDYLNKYDEALCELYRIERCIECLDNETERNLMRKRYIQGLNWEDICVELNYSWRQIHNIHSSILKKIV